MHASFEIMAISPTPVLILLVGSDTSRQRSHVVALLSALAGCILQLVHSLFSPYRIIAGVVYITQVFVGSVSVQSILI